MITRGFVTDKIITRGMGSIIIVDYVCDTLELELYIDRLKTLEVEL